MAEKVSKTLQSIRRIESRLDNVESRLDKLESRFGTMASRLDDLGTEVEVGFASVHSKMNEGFIRTSTEMAAVLGAVNQVRDAVIARLDVRDRVDAIDRRLTELERKAG